MNAKLDVQSADYKVKETIGSGFTRKGKVVASFQDYVKSPTVLFPDFVTPAIYGVLAKEGIKNGSGNPIVVPTSTGLV